MKEESGREGSAKSEPSDEETQQRCLQVSEEKPKEKAKKPK
jgi:hypothetical protein